MESKHIKKEIFLGFNAYTESDADIFKGRDADIEHLYDLVSNKDYVLCYAESGEGKSSLIDAGLTPRLRTNRYFPVKIAFTDEEYNNNNIVFDEVIKSRIMEAVSEQQNLSFVPKSDSIFNEKYSNDLWWFLRNNTLSLYGISFTIVLIFDQFEEVINYPKSDAWTSRFFAFLEKISSDDCPQYILDDINATVDSHDDLDFPNIPLKKNFKAIFSIRTEYIGELDYWCMQRYFIPDLKHNRFCLKPLTLQGADEVMRQYEGFDAELRDSIKDVLLRLKNKDNRTADDNNVYEQYIPALILSIVCTSLYQNSNKVLTDSLIADSIENFYNDKIKECNISLEERNTIASVLVDKDKRVRVASDCSALEKIKFNKKYKDALLRNRLIKKSNVNGVEYIELVHDSLIDVVKKHKEEAIQKELRKKRRRNMAIFSIMTSIILLFVILIIGLKKNEKNFLITQAKFIAAEAEKLAENGDRYMCIKLLDYVGRNNKYSLKNSDFEYAMRSIDCNYKLAEKCFIHEDGVQSAVFSSDGRYVVTASNDNTSKIWSVETGDCLQTLSHEDGVESAVFSSDGRYVVTASGDNTSSSDGRYVVTASFDNTSKIWSVETGDCLQTLSHGSWVNSAIFSSDGRYVVTASGDNTSKIWSVETGDCLQTLSHEDDVVSAVFSSDGRYVVTASDDKTSKIWSVETGDCVQTLSDGAWVRSAIFSSDGRYVVTASADNTSKIWSVETGDCLQTLSHEDGVVSAVFSSDGRYVVTASHDNTSKIWSVETGDCVQTLSHEDGVVSAVFSSDGRYVVTASNDNTSKIWSVETGDCLQTLSHEDGVGSAIFSSDGRYVVTASGDNTSKIWSVETGDCLQTLSHEHWVSSAIFSSDGRYVVTASGDNTSKIWSVETGDCLQTLSHGSWVISAIFSSDGRYVVTASGDNTSKIWSVETGDCLQTLSHEHWVSSAIFSSDGRYVVTASGDNTSKIWSVETGDCLQTLSHGSWVNSAIFSSDGRYVVTAFLGKARIFPFLPISEILDKWSEMLGPNAELTKEEKARYFLN